MPGKKQPVNMTTPSLLIFLTVIFPAAGLVLLYGALVHVATGIVPACFLGSDFVQPYIFQAVDTQGAARCRKLHMPEGVCVTLQAMSC